MFDNGFLLLVLMCYGSTLLELLTVRQCRRNPIKCQDFFMTQNGWSNSLFGYWFFFGRPAAARKAIVENEKLRRWFIRERYLRAFASAALGTVVLANYVF